MKLGRQGNGSHQWVSLYLLHASYAAVKKTLKNEWFLLRGFYQNPVL